MLFTNQKGRAPYRLRRGLLDPCNQRGRARYRLREAVLDRCNQIKGWVRDIVCAGGCCTAAIKEGVRDIVCTGLDPCNQKGRAPYRLRRGLLDPCNQRGRARYRLRGVLLDHCNQIKGGCATSSARGAAGLLQLQGGCARSP